MLSNYFVAYLFPPARKVSVLLNGMPRRCLILTYALSFIVMPHMSRATEQLEVEGKQMEVGPLVTEGPNIRHYGFVLLDGIFAEVGIYLYPDEEGATEDEEDGGDRPSMAAERFTGLIAGHGVTWLDVDGESEENQCWSPIRFKMYELEAIPDDYSDTYLMMEFQNSDCPAAKRLPKRVILKRNDDYYHRENERESLPQSMVMGGYVEVYSSIDRTFPVDFFQVMTPNFVEKPRITFENEAELHAAVAPSMIDDYGEQPAAPDQACVLVVKEEAAEFRKRLAEIPELWWYNNVFTLESARSAMEAYYSKNEELDLVLRRYAHGKASRQSEIMSLTDSCYSDPQFNNTNDIQLFQLQSYPFMFEEMFRKVNLLKSLSAERVYFATAGGTPRDFFEVGSWSIQNEEGELDTFRLERVLRKGLELALVDVSKAEILADHPARIPFAYDFEVSGFGGALSGDRTRWEVFRVESSVAMSPNSHADGKSRTISDLVLSVGLPITRARVRREADPPPLNLEDGFEEKTDDPAFRRFLMKFKSQVCIITRCGLSSSDLYDIEHSWLNDERR